MPNGRGYSSRDVKRRSYTGKKSRSYGGLWNSVRRIWGTITRTSRRTGKLPPISAYGKGSRARKQFRSVFYKR